MATKRMVGRFRTAPSLVKINGNAIVPNSESQKITGSLLGRMVKSVNNTIVLV